MTKNIIILNLIFFNCISSLAMDNVDRLVVAVESATGALALKLAMGELNKIKSYNEKQIELIKAEENNIQQLNKFLSCFHAKPQFLSSQTEKHLLPEADRFVEVNVYSFTNLENTQNFRLVYEKNEESFYPQKLEIIDLKRRIHNIYSANSKLNGNSVPYAHLEPIFKYVESFMPDQPMDTDNENLKLEIFKNSMMKEIDSATSNISTIKCKTKKELRYKHLMFHINLLIMVGGGTVAAHMLSTSFK